MIDVKSAEVLEVVSRLVNRDFQWLEEHKCLARLTARDLERVLNEYGRTFCPYPSSEALQGELYTVQGGDRCRIEVPLLTLEEGRSDLEVFLTARMQGADVCIEIDDLRVP
jgi:hypothetical protein|nr:hypothetical protein [uncultured Caldimonas sp.]